MTITGGRKRRRAATQAPVIPSGARQDSEGGPLENVARVLSLTCRAVPSEAVSLAGTHPPQRTRIGAGTRLVDRRVRTGIAHGASVGHRCGTATAAQPLARFR